MITDFIIGFVQFLNKNEYNISQEKILRFFNMIYSLNISFTNQDDLLDLMKTVFCSKRSETEYIDKYFNEYKDIYFAEIINEKKVVEIQEQKTKEENKHQSSLKSKEDLMLQLDQELKNKIQEIREEIINYDQMLKDKDKKFLKKNFEKLKEINAEYIEINKFLDKFHDEKDCVALSHIFKKESNSLIKKSEELLMNGNLKDFKLENNFYNILKKLLNKLDKNKIENRIESGTKDLQQKKELIQEEIEKEKKEHERIMNDLNQVLKNSKLSTESKIIKKEESKRHREIFIGGKNFIQLDDETKGILDKSFSSLNKEERNIILRYMKNNLLKFKTKMSRNINSNEKLNLNIKDTIQQACKTGGLPLNLIFDKPVKNKTNLVLVLDVSGSCSSASKMMLTFMYLLKDVFPRGCDTFAFVNSLYDISEIMNSDDIERAINDVLSTIPRKGVYSNYYNPLKTLWSDYKKKLTKDSFVIFMGDARNNKNENAEEFMKNIGHRVKKCVWLNTETIDKWNKADSLANLYGKYSEMYEVVNTRELIEFIENF